MKTKKSLFLTITLALFSIVAFSQMAGTAHDFSNETWAGGNGSGNEGQICIVCHIPHNTTSTVSDAPLWNRGALELSGSVTYEPYQSTTFDADDGTLTGTIGDDAVFTNASYADYLLDGASNVGGVWTPTGNSILCLTCHDGVGNLDAFGNTDNGSTYALSAGNSANRVGELAVRADGTKEHPFSFTFSQNLFNFDGELKDPSTTAVADLLQGGANGKVECSSCHDVHNSAGISDGLLVMSNAQSALCTTCHAK